MNKLFFRYTYFFLCLLFSSAVKIAAMDSMEGTDYINDDVAEVSTLLFTAKPEKHDSSLNPQSTISEAVATQPETTMPVSHTESITPSKTQEITPVLPETPNSSPEPKMERMFPPSTENVAVDKVLVPEKNNIFASAKAKCVATLATLNTKKRELTAYFKDVKARGFNGLKRKEQIAFVIAGTAFVATTAYIIYKIYKSYNCEKEESKNKNLNRYI